MNKMMCDLEEFVTEWIRTEKAKSKQELREKNLWTWHLIDLNLQYIVTEKE